MSRLPWRTLCAITCLGAVCTTAAPSAVAAEPPVISHAPRVALPSPKTATNASWSSSNWSGYAITGSGFNSITGDWTVPTVQPSTKATYSSSWIGIDGFNNSSLIQTGTEQDYYNGSAHYQAWWEILPAAETVIPSLTIHPGDHMHASIQNLGGGTWSITLQDVTTSQSFTTKQAYSGPQTSAEWIQEAPTVNGRVATLANYGEATFDPDTVNGGNPHLTSTEGGVMIQNGVQVSTPSSPDSDTDGFDVAYGSATPAPPAS
ncbi:hypothetical protein GCM10025857_35520 [Alicyclobacillus contaminans]|uniref:G1 family glutamic endopeptidase n=1 Tax=Alicyclobacillus contaminans TaxID=392016 RepID=UPI000421B1E4|nr:G1 family glutamic endopeptidase [Alicyclobacillus contaminans]GMA52195.1 hypothetical protein GCM10025857_35520 [Alicyclobacillus contaminans]